MNIQNISSELKFVNRIGQTLSTQQIVFLQASVLKLSNEYHFEVFNFWGRIEGTAKNYYIVEGLNFKGATHFPIKKYFWSSEDFKFAELPAQRKEYVPQVINMTSFFTGQHQKILLKEAGVPKKVFNLDGQDFKLDRLSIIVHLIDHDCQIVPLGSYKMIPTHQLIKDPSFRGLKITEISKLQNYVHLRAPQHQQKKILIECDKALERSDFLDSLNQDPIKQSWSIQTDQSKSEATVRSLIWQGYVGYHRSNSPVFGGVYMGAGIRCEDLAFLV